MNQLLLGIFLGWALALSSPLIIERVQRSQKAKDLKRALSSELLELRYTLAAAVWQLRHNMGKVDHDLLSWLCTMEEGYSGPAKDWEMAEAVKQLQKLPANQIKGMTSGQPGVRLNLKTYDVPFLASQLHNVPLLPVITQQRLLTIQSKLGVINQAAIELTRWLERTFDSGLSYENRRLTQDNLDAGYAFQADNAQRLADEITKVLGELE